MARKNEDFSQSDLSYLMRQPEAQELLNRLRQLDSAALSQAVHQAMQGNTEQAKELLNPLMQDRQVQDLADRMRNGHGGI